MDEKVHGKFSIIKEINLQKIIWADDELLLFLMNKKNDSFEYILEIPLNLIWS